MKKIIITSALLTGIVTMAQETKGKVGINTDKPQATLEIQPNTANADANATTNEGIIAPKLSKERIAKITNPVEGTLVYATDNAYAGKDDKVAKITEKGYYFYNGIEWVKSGNAVADEFIPTTITDVYGKTLSGIKLVDTSSGINEKRSLFGISDKGGFYLHTDESAAMDVVGNTGAEFRVQSSNNVYHGKITILGGSESYGQIYIGTVDNKSKDEKLWAFQNVGEENTVPQVADRLGDLGLRFNDKQIALFKKDGKVSIGSNVLPKATLSLSSDLGTKYATKTGEERYDVLHIHESNNSAYGLGIHYSTLEMYGNGENSQVQIGSRTSDGTGVFTPNVTFKGQGNVGIGTESPTEKLEVNGKIKAANVIFTGIPTYENDTAASTLKQGEMYKTSAGVLMIKK